MILGPISLLDCAIFVLFLIPNFLVLVGPIQTLSLAKVIPFLGIATFLPLSRVNPFASTRRRDESSGTDGTPVFQLPCQFVRERYMSKREAQSPFVQNATIFEDVVVRCVRYAFARIPSRIGRVFFSKWVALPFFRFRLLRHGYLTSPIRYTEVDRNGVRGLWISGDHPAAREKPDLVVYYLHGGGFSMGSTYFYLEFLIAWVTMLKAKGFRYPAIFALEYSLVPDETWPRQFEETRAGYRFLCDYLGASSRICVSGDSAGATLILSLLLRNEKVGEPVARPGLAVLLSPWTHLVSELNQNTPSDYLDSDSLHLYARQYAGKASVDDAVISPGRTLTGWQVSAPVNGYHIMFGAEEVFAPGIQEMVKSMKRSGASVETTQEDAGIHAWPVVDLFLADAPKDRLRGLRHMTEVVYSKMGPK
jgi:acetyl esterase/lipase